MSERKVVNKYYPPDFDPAKIPRRSKSQQQQINVRIMLAISIRCGTCGTYIYRGTKFNSRKEDVLGETYLGIEIFRFYIKCKECSAEIVLKTDPEKSGYLVEAGARRNFEPDEEEEEEQVGDVMEIRRLASKREMDTLSGLDELKSLKARRARQSVDSVFESLQQQQQRSATLHELEEEEKDKQELDMFKRSRRICVDSLMLQPILPKVDIFQGSRRDELQHKKRKPASYYYLSVPKKLPAAKTQESTSNGLALLCQHYDSINDQD